MLACAHFDLPRRQIRWPRRGGPRAHEHHVRIAVFHVQFVERDRPGVLDAVGVRHRVTDGGHGGAGRLGHRQAHLDDFDGIGGRIRHRHPVLHARGDRRVDQWCAIGLRDYVLERTAHRRAPQRGRRAAGDGARAVWTQRIHHTHVGDWIRVGLGVQIGERQRVLDGLAQRGATVGGVGCLGELQIARHQVERRAVRVLDRDDRAGRLSRDRDQVHQRIGIALLDHIGVLEDDLILPARLAIIRRQDAGAPRDGPHDRVEDAVSDERVSDRDVLKLDDARVEDAQIVSDRVAHLGHVRAGFRHGWGVFQANVFFHAHRHALNVDHCLRGVQDPGAACVPGHSDPVHVRIGIIHLQRVGVCVLELLAGIEPIGVVDLGVLLLRAVREPALDGHVAIRQPGIGDDQPVERRAAHVGHANRVRDGRASRRGGG